MSHIISSEEKIKSPLSLLGDTVVLKNVVKTGEDYRALEEFRSCMRDFAREYIKTFFERNGKEINTSELLDFEKETYGTL